MSRKQTNPDLGEAPCPTCGNDVPFRKDKRGRMYPVCPTCKAQPNEYFLTRGRFRGADGAVPPKQASAARPDEIVVPARPTPAKVAALSAEPESPAKTGESTGDGTDTDTGFLDDDSVPDQVTEPAPVPGKRGGFKRLVQRANQDFEDWFHTTIGDPDL